MGKTSNKRILSVVVEMIPDQDADTSYLEQEGFEERLARYRDGEFGHIGIQARAQVTINGCWQNIRSAGLWGIESDSDNGHLSEIAKQELKELRAMLRTIGFSTRAISAAFVGVAR